MSDNGGWAIQSRKFHAKTGGKTTNDQGVLGYLLLRGVVDEADALLDVALEALDRGVQE